MLLSKMSTPQAKEFSPTMMNRKQPTNWIEKFKSALELMARPMQGGQGRNETVIQPYRGYGSRREIFVMGRVFKQYVRRFPGRDDSLMTLLFDIGRRFLRRGFANAGISVRFNGSKTRVKTDRYGFFVIRLPVSLPSADRLWQGVNLRLVDRDNNGGVETKVYLPPETARYVVISDIDDTVIHTGVANKISMLWRLFAKKAESRTAFPGVAALYRAFHAGKTGHDLNPMLYVSRGPWSIYEVLEEFFNLHRIPIGPILFLRYWGLTFYHPLPKRSKDHKLNLIRRMLLIYKEMPFILIGDSGQKDPEIYARIVREHPGRILAVYIRDVSRNARRYKAIDKLSKQVNDAGSTLLLTTDSFALAEHAAKQGFISPQALASVLKDRREGGTPESVEPSPRIAFP